MGAYAGMLTGFLTMNGIYWYRYFATSPNAAKEFAPVAASIAIVAPFVTVPIVSLITRPLPTEIVEKAFAAGRPTAE
jgi:Na+/proline symporter